ncbi:MAG TPA: ABC transporter permease [Dongiaceae bacterium]|nr:ABC transporter permease [Dongiaceae bacterium]
MTNLLTLTRTRMVLALRNKMFFFFSVVMPLLFFFLYAGIFAKGDPNRVRFFLGPVLALNVMGSFWGLSATLVMYREQGILRRFHVAPVSASDMLASSVLANFILTLPTVTVVLLFARFIFHVHDLGDLLAAFLFVCAGTISFGSLGLVVASITNTMQETQVINQLLWLPLIFLSGATFPLGYLPDKVQRISAFLPATYLVTGLQEATLFSKHVNQLLVYFVVLVLWSALSFTVASQLFRWEPETKIPRNAKMWAAATIIPFILLGVWESGNGQMLKQAREAHKVLEQSYSAPAPNGKS